MALAKTHLVVTLGSHLFGFPIESVDSVLRMDALTPIPLAPDAILGIINMRGSILPVVSLRKRLGLPEETEQNSEPKAIVCFHVGDELCGLCVDRVEKSYSFQESDRQPCPVSFLKPEGQECVTGTYAIKGKILIILSIEHVLTFQNSSLPNVHEVSYEIWDYRSSSSSLSRD